MEALTLRFHQQARLLVAARDVDIHIHGACNRFVALSFVLRGGSGPSNPLTNGFGAVVSHHCQQLGVLES